MSQSSTPLLSELSKACKEGDHAKKRELLEKYLSDKSLKWKYEVVPAERLVTGRVWAVHQAYGALGPQQKRVVKKFV